MEDAYNRCLGSDINTCAWNKCKFDVRVCFSLSDGTVQSIKSRSFSQCLYVENWFGDMPLTLTLLMYKMRWFGGTNRKFMACAGIHSPHPAASVVQYLSRRVEANCCGRPSMVLIAPKNTSRKMGLHRNWSTKILAPTDEGLFGLLGRTVWGPETGVWGDVYSCFLDIGKKHTWKAGAAKLIETFAWRIHLHLV